MAPADLHEEGSAYHHTIPPGIHFYSDAACYIKS